MICIYHSRDLDGACSGAIVKKKYPNATLIGYDYGQPFPWESITGLEPVIMVDVSLPMEDMFKLHNKSNFQFTWIDHHASAISDFKVYCEKSVKYSDHFITAGRWHIGLRRHMELPFQRSCYARGSLATGPVRHMEKR